MIQHRTSRAALFIIRAGGAISEKGGPFCSEFVRKSRLSVRAGQASFPDKNSFAKPDPPRSAPVVSLRGSRSRCQSGSTLALCSTAGGVMAR